MSESLSKIILRAVEGTPEGEIITCRSFPSIPREQAMTIAKILGRLVQRGILRRAGRGRYYRPEVSPIFGEIPEHAEKIFATYLVKDGEVIGYLTGVNAYNKLCLTTQLSTEMRVASVGRSHKTGFRSLKVRYVESRVPVSRENMNLLPLLDALKDIRRIPDASPEETLPILRHWFERLSSTEIAILVDAALRYPPRVRALLGAVLTSLDRAKRAQAKLRSSLNQLTVFRLPRAAIEALPSLQGWQYRAG